MINKVTLIGNLGRDPEVKRFDTGGMVAKFSLATNENYKDRNGDWQTQTEWHDVVCWGSLAERAERNLRKGSLAYVEGKLTHRKYTDQNNVERYITEVVATIFRPLDRVDRSSNMPGMEHMPGNVDTRPAESSMPESPSTSNEPSEKEDLPF
jgi:single-strand DNA-binding protein